MCWFYKALDQAAKQQLTYKNKCEVGTETTGFHLYTEINKDTQIIIHEYLSYRRLDHLSCFTLFLT